MSDTVGILQKAMCLYDDLMSLREQVAAKIKPTALTGRELTCLYSQRFVFAENNITPAYYSITNRSPAEVYLEGASFAVYQTTASVDGYAQLISTPNGLFTAVGGDGCPIFDFEWTYKVLGSDYGYSKSTTANTWLSREALGSSWKKTSLTFKQPILVKQIQSIEFGVRPILYALNGTTSKSTNSSYSVFMMLYGFRNALSGDAILVPDTDAP